MTQKVSPDALYSIGIRSLENAVSLIRHAVITGLEGDREQYDDLSSLITQLCLLRQKVEHGIRLTTGEDFP